MSTANHNLPPGVTQADVCDPPIPKGMHECPECARLTYSRERLCYACQIHHERLARAGEQVEATGKEQP